MKTGAKRFCDVATYAAWSGVFVCCLSGCGGSGGGMSPNSDGRVNWGDAASRAQLSGTWNLVDATITGGADTGGGTATAAADEPCVAPAPLMLTASPVPAAWEVPTAPSLQPPDDGSTGGTADSGDAGEAVTVSPCGYAGDQFVIREDGSFDSLEFDGSRFQMNRFSADGGMFQCGYDGNSDGAVTGDELEPAVPIEYADASHDVDLSGGDATVTWNGDEFTIRSPYAFADSTGGGSGEPTQYLERTYRKAKP